MKRCPQCRRDYFDETLLYCLDDGERLLEGPASDEAVTAIHTGSAGEAITAAQYDSLAAKENLQPASKIKYLIVAATGILLVAALGVGYFYNGRGDRKAIDSIAVMPFANESGNVEIDYLSDGIPESLITSLSKIPNLTVKPRSSVFRYKGKIPEPATLGKELNVQSILTGTVVQRGSELSLNIELVDAATERVLWSEVYQRPLSNLLALQTEIARKVSSELKAKLSGAEESQLAKNSTNNPEAYQLYLKGRSHFGKRTKDDLHKAIDHYRRAVAIDPDYALAYSGLADVYLILGGYDKSRTRLEFTAEGRSYAQRALALDDGLSQAHNSNGVFLQAIDHDFAGAEVAFRRAIALDPNNATAFSNLGGLMTCLGRMDEAEASYRRALEIEPASAIINRSWGGFLATARRYEESVEQLKKTVDLEPNFILGHLTLANTYMQQRNYSEAVNSYIESRRLIGYDSAILSKMRGSFERGGWPEFIASMDNGVWPELYRTSYIKATQFASIGEKEKALAQLEKAYNERDGFIPLINVDPRLDALRDDSRFQELVKKVGF